MPEGLKRLIEPFMALTPGKRMLIAAVVFIAAMAFAVLIFVANRTDYRPLFTNLTAEDAGAYKPDNRPYLVALERLGLVPADVLFVAGSAHDVGGAGRVGLDVYWANRGSAPAPDDGLALRTEPDLRALLDIVES